jgi:hypothetical protein
LDFGRSGARETEDEEEAEEAFFCRLMVAVGGVS